MAAISARFRFRRESLILRRWAAAPEAAASGMRRFLIAESRPGAFRGRNIPAPFETRGVFPLCEEAFGEGGKRVYMPFQPRAEIFSR